MKRSFSLNSAITLEGHLKLKVVLDDNNQVIDVESSNVSFKDTGLLLKGRDKREVPRLAMRLFGVGASNHYQRSVEAVEKASSIEIPKEAQLVRDLINSFYYIYDHISHFYHLHGLDWIDINKALTKCTDETLQRKIDNQIKQGTFQLDKTLLIDLTPEENLNFLKNYFEALTIQGEIMKILNLLGCKTLFPNNFIIGGVVTPAILEDEGKKEKILESVEKIKKFINKNYKTDLLLILKSYKKYKENFGVKVKNFLSVGDFFHEKGKEILPSGIVKNGVYSPINLEEISGLIFQGFKEKRNRELKEYFSEEVEVGPLARAVVAYAKKENIYADELDNFFRSNDVSEKLLTSFLGRHIARFIETRIVSSQVNSYISLICQSLHNENSSFSKPVKNSQIDEKSFGYSLSESSRGTIGHFLSLSGGRVENYTSYVPTNFNTSTKKSLGVYEGSLIGIKVSDPKNPIEILQVIHSFNQCVCCTLILTDQKGKGFGLHKIDTSCTI